MRNNASVLAQSVSRSLPSSATSFNCTQIGDSSSSINSLSLTLPQYCLGVGLSVSASITSTTEKYHSSLCQILRTFFPSNTDNLFIVGHPNHLLFSNLLTFLSSVNSHCFAINTKLLSPAFFLNPSNSMGLK